MSSSKPFQPDLKTTDELFSEKSLFAIPRNQRPYDWTVEHAADLYSDLWESIKTKHPLFLGQVLFCQNSTGALEIIDGQQRITTISLLMACLRLQAWKLGLTGKQQSLHKRLCSVDDRDSWKCTGLRLLASPSISKVYEAIARNHEWDGSVPSIRNTKLQARRLRPVIELFLRGTLPGESRKLDLPSISALDEAQFKQFQDAVGDCYWMQIVVARPDTAFEIFERANARGMDLEVSDLLKNYLYSEDIPDIGAKWDKISENGKSGLVTMLRQYHIAHVGHLKKAELYRKLKVRSTALGPEPFTDEIVEYSAFFSACREPDGFVEWVAERFPELAKRPKLSAAAASLRTLRAFGQTQFLPVLFSFCKTLNNEAVAGAKRAGMLASVLRAFECFHFINNSVVGSAANTVEHPFAELAAGVQALSCQDAQEQIVAKLRELSATREKFVSAFASLTYDESVSVIRYIFHSFLDLDYSTSPPAVRVTHPRTPENSVWHPHRSALGTLWHVHHMMPQSMRDKDNESTTWIDRIGNLVPLPGAINQSLGTDLPPLQAAKLASTFKSEVDKERLLRHFVEAHEADMRVGWSQTIADKRGHDLGALAFDVVWTF